MKKIVLMLAVCILLTGCSVVRIDTKDISNITGVILEKDNSLYNYVGKGYKYYIPRGVNHIDTIGFNDVLYSNGNYYYLYIDAPAYVNKIEQKYKEDKSLYYSKKIEANNKKGYLEIEKTNDKYYIRFSYNYATLEALVNENSIDEVIINASYILSTIKYNDKVMALSLDDDYFKNREEQYKEFVSKKKTSNFLLAPEEVPETIE